MKRPGCLVDLRSDTVTRPTPRMRKAMAEARVGDDGYGEDPTVRALEELGAEMTGKEAALFVPTGTFGNQLALMTHCRRGQEVILDEDSHIVANEMGASAAIAGVQLRPVCIPEEGGPGAVPLADLRRRLRGGEGLHSPSTGLICLENSPSSGGALPLDYMDQVRRLADGHAVPVHLDGARLFNAAVALGARASALTAQADSVMFCLSKGLCAPVGSLLAGSRTFIARARENRQMMGGGMRQAGVLAAPGLVALGEMPERLAEDHQNAAALRDALAEGGFAVRAGRPMTNILFFRDADLPEPEALLFALGDLGVRLNPPQRGWYRLVTHYGVGRADALYAAGCLIQQKKHKGA